ncbi:MAG TPA: hypothetical protein VGK67_20375 [Myxococcales bacterium]|jgi:hypothetical protein
MDFAKWVAEFKVVHAKNKKGQLAGDELAKYLADRNELARAVLANQRVSVRMGQQPRSLLKAARILPIEIEIAGRLRPLMTIDVGPEGFSALTGEAPGSDRPVAIVLKLPGSTEPVNGDAVCVGAVKGTGNYKCQFKFGEALGPKSRERIEQFVFDDLLDHLKT